MILLDTKVVIAFFNGKPNNIKKDTGRDQQNQLECFISGIRVGLWRKGISEGQKKSEKKLYRFVDIVRVFPFELECAKIFGTI